MVDDTAAALIPQAERTVEFYGDPIIVGLGQDNALYVPVRSIAEFLGLDWPSQYKRIQRDEVLADRVHMVMMTGPDGRPRPMVCLPLDLLPGWLFGITTRRVRPELAPKLRRYREECFRVLWQTFQSEVAQHVPSPSAPSAPLTQVRDLALAIAQMAEQQLDLETNVTNVRAQVHQVTEQQQIVHARMDRAAVVIKEIEQRLGAVEQQVAPAAYITDEQAAEISTAVKALAQVLTSKEPGKNQYQGVFAELYRRFHVSSYKRIRQDQFTAVLTFLEEWHTAAEVSGGDA